MESTIDVARHYGKELVALFIPFLTLFLNSAFRAKARLVQGIPHTFTFLVQQPLTDAQGKVISPTQTAHTRSYLVGNTGRETATGVEVVFNWKPDCINVWPPRHFDERIEPDNRCTLIFSSLAPNEFLGIESLSINKDLPEVLVVRSNQCVAETIDMRPQQVFPQWWIRLATFFFFAGMALVVYMVIVVLQLLVLKTPIGL